MPSQSDLLATFTHHFARAIRQEMATMRERMGPFEMPLGCGRKIETDDAAEGSRFSYRLLSPDSRLVVGMECSLRFNGGECLVRVEDVEDLHVTLSSAREIAPDTSATLVFYPWFLYERLLSVLAEINEKDFSVARAMTLFGKLKPTTKPGKLLREHLALNESQRAAVQLCLNSDLAFVWGPPGTGKTTTLAHIVDELSGNGLRILVLSTTNAAIDQALEKIVQEPGIAMEIESGRVVRIGRSDAPLFGTGLRDVVDRIHGDSKENLNRYISRRSEIHASLSACKTATDALPSCDGPVQMKLFCDADEQNTSVALDGIFNHDRHAVLRQMPKRELAGMIRRRGERLGTIRSLLNDRINNCRKSLQGKEQMVVDRAGLILTTLTNAYFSPLMNGQRFDVVIVEEASMAILPTLFYAACLGSKKTVIVGDPCQLPSIVQSDADYVRQVMGRSIFEVTVPEPMKSPFVAFLDVQYRMHPVIGTLVSELFYEGKLRHAAKLGKCSATADLEPYAGAPLMILDTAGRSVCRKSPRGQSRLNETTARACVDLAQLAISSGAQSVAIITPYADQARIIRSLLKGEIEDDQRIECSTVHRFQGSERDVIILDTVDAEPMQPGVLLNETGRYSSAYKLVNVAISRARGKLIIVADVEYFRKRAPNGVMSQVIARALKTGRCELLK
ncbi:MAG: AAA family ATPase [Candidatus Riflebacteria bacterium]|nr:AAA family ATPase [Candidatus Riflebacteria bacterium]